jgi:hypothetical protein
MVILIQCDRQYLSDLLINKFSAKVDYYQQAQASTTLTELAKVIKLNTKSH